jgi:hypothetical protein
MLTSKVAGFARNLTLYPWHPCDPWSIPPLVAALQLLFPG